MQPPALPSPAAPSPALHSPSGMAGEVQAAGGECSERGLCAGSPLIFFFFLLLLRFNLMELKFELGEKFDYRVLPAEVSHARRAALHGCSAPLWVLHSLPARRAQHWYRVGGASKTAIRESAPKPELAAQASTDPNL